MKVVPGDLHFNANLAQAGIECIVVHAADVSSSDKEKKRKTDKVDALKLARNLAADHLTGIHVPR